MELRMRKAIYLAIVLGFLRKILARMRRKPLDFPGSVRKLPGEPGYTLENDTVTPRRLALVLVAPKMEEAPFLVGVGEEFMMCNRDSVRIMMLPGFPEYHRNARGLKMNFTIMDTCLLAQDGLTYADLLTAIEGTWMSKEVKDFCVEGTAFVNRAIGKTRRPAMG